MDEIKTLQNNFAISINNNDAYAITTTSKDFLDFIHSKGATGNIYYLHNKIKKAHARIKASGRNVDEWFTYHQNGQSREWHLTRKGAVRIAIEFPGDYFQEIKDIIVEQFMEGETPRDTFLDRGLEWAFEAMFSKHGDSVPVKVFLNFFDDMALNTTKEEDLAADRAQLGSDDQSPLIKGVFKLINSVFKLTKKDE